MMFANTDYLALLLLVPLLTLLCAASWRKRKKLLDQLAFVGMLEQLVGKGVARRRIAQSVFALIAVGGIAFAAAGPRLGFAWQQQKMEGVTLAVVLDVSRSMDAQDISPSRLEFARRKLLDLAGMLRGDAVGLVIFAGGAYLRLPPTVDYDTFKWALGDSDTATIRSQGTSLAGALDVATRMLGRAEGAGKALLLVSDGEGHDDQEEVDAAVAKAVAANVHIYALGVGTSDGAPIALPDGGFKKDASGNVVISKLEEDRLKALASATGGAYVRAVASEEDVQTLYDTEIRGKLQAANRGVRQEKRWHERYQWPLALALGSAVLSAMMGIGRRRGPGAAVALLLLFPLAAHAGAASDGMEAWKAGQWEKAIPLLGQARVDDPANREVARALAESLYHSGRYREAESLYNALADSAPNPKEQAVYDYNAGNSAYHAGRLNEALENFQESSERDPSFKAAKQNAEVVQKELQMRLQQEPPPKDQQDPQQDQQQDPQQGQQQNPQNQDQQDQQQNQQGQQGQSSSQGDQKKDPNGDPKDPSQQDPTKTQDPSGDSKDGDKKEGQPTEASELSDGQGTPAEEAAQEDPDKMTAEQAARLVDSVPDGKPHTAVGGASDGRDW